MPRLPSRCRAWRSRWWVCLLLAVASCKRRPPPAGVELAPAPSVTSPPVVGRCSTANDTGAFVLGEEVDDGGAAARHGAATPGHKGGESIGGDLIPFAAEVGDGVAWRGGFAVGALHRAAGALSYAIVILDARGHNGRLVALGAAHGEPEPPRVAAGGALLVAGVLEPQGESRVLRLAKIDERGVTWGATMHEKPGESQAFDLAVGEQKAIAVWDEDGPEVSTIQMATFDAATVTALTTPRAVSGRQTDAESPRVLPRRGGFWLTYIARRTVEEDGDARDLAEDIGYRWIETVALDENGSPTGPARSVSAKDGHVLVFDVADGPDDGILVVFRDDDTPSGSGGGAVMRALVRPAAIEPPTVLVSVDVGAGAPSLIGDWLALLDAADTTRMAPISKDGQLAAALLPEPEIGAGEPVAAGPEGLLIARPMGRDIKLSVLRCAAPPGSP